MLLPLLAPLAISAGSSILGSILGSRKSGMQKDAEKAGRDLIPQLTADAGLDRATSNQFKDIALPALGNSVNYYQSLLDPNSSKALNAALGPQREKLTEGMHRGLLTQLSEFAPRGGGRVAMGGQALQELNKQLMDLLASGRAQGAQGLLQTGAAAGGMAGQFASLSANQRQALAAFISDVINGGNRQRNQSGSFFGGLGSSIGGILADIFSGTGGAGNGGGAGGAGGGSYDSGD